MVPVPWQIILLGAGRECPPFAVEGERAANQIPAQHCKACYKELSGGRAPWLRRVVADQAGGYLMANCLPQTLVDVCKVERRGGLARSLCAHVGYSAVGERRFAAGRLKERFEVSGSQ